MSGIKDQESLEDVRKRLYERGTPKVSSVGHTLSDVVHVAPTSWKEPTKPIVLPPVQELPSVQEREQSFAQDIGMA